MVKYSRVEFNYVKISSGDEKKWNGKLTAREGMDVTVSVIIKHGKQR
jgi:ribosome maturation factor RimP